MPDSNVAQAGGPGYPEWLVDDLLRHMPRSGKAAWHKGKTWDLAADNVAMGHWVTG